MIFIHAVLLGIFHLILTLINYDQSTLYSQTGIINVGRTFGISVCEREQSTKRNVIYKTIEITSNYFLFVFNKCFIEKIFVPNMVLRSDKV